MKSRAMRLLASSVLGAAMVCTGGALAMADDSAGPDGSLGITDPVPGPVTPPQAEPQNGPLRAHSCVVTSWTPRAEKNQTYVWFGGSRSNCSGSWYTQLIWSGHGAYSTKQNPKSGGWYGVECRWGSPQSRSMYGLTVSGKVKDTSSSRTFTSARTNCTL